MISWWRTGALSVIVGSWLWFLLVALSEPLLVVRTDTMDAIDETVSLTNGLFLALTAVFFLLPVVLYLDRNIGAAWAVANGVGVLLAGTDQFYSPQTFSRVVVPVGLMIAAGLLFLVVAALRQAAVRTFLSGMTPGAAPDLSLSRREQRKFLGSRTDISITTVAAALIALASAGYGVYEIANAAEQRAGGALVQGKLISEDDDQGAVYSVEANWKAQCRMAYVEGVSIGDTETVLFNPETGWCEQASSPFEPFAPFFTTVAALGVLGVRQLRYSRRRAAFASAFTSPTAVEVSIAQLERRQFMHRPVRAAQFLSDDDGWLESRLDPYVSPCLGVAEKGDALPFAELPQVPTGSVDRHVSGRPRGFLVRPHEHILLGATSSTGDGMFVYEQGPDGVVVKLAESALGWAGAGLAGAAGESGYEGATHTQANDDFPNGLDPFCRNPENPETPENPESPVKPESLVSSVDASVEPEEALIFPSTVHRGQVVMYVPGEKAFMVAELVGLSRRSGPKPSQVGLTSTYT